MAAPATPPEGGARDDGIAGAAPGPPPKDGAAAHLHATALSWLGRGLLLRGPSSSGKSSLALRLMTAGAYLVADDLVRLEQRNGVLYAAAAAGPGLIELRAAGIFRVVSAGAAPVDLCVDLVGDGDAERLPERRSTTLLGRELPLLRVASGDPAAEARIQVALLAEPVA